MDSGVSISGGSEVKEQTTKSGPGSTVEFTNKLFFPILLCFLPVKQPVVIAHSKQQYRIT